MMLKAILKNSSYLLLAQIFTKVASFFYTFFLARQLGVVEFGNYSVALSYFSVLSAVVDLGVSRFMIREVSKDSTRFLNLFVNSLVIRLVFSISLVFIFGLVLFLTDPDKARFMLSLIAAFTIIPQSVGLTFDSGLIAKNKFKYSALGIITLNISTILLGVWLTFHGVGASGALIAVVGGHVLYMIGTIFLLLISTNDLKNLFGQIQKSTMHQIVKGSLLYGVMSMLGLVYFKVDTLLLAYLKGSFDAGVYSAAYRFLEGIIFIPAAFETAFFPVMSRMNASREFNFKLYLQSLGILTILSIPFVVSFWYFVPWLISKYLQSEYLTSISVVGILALAVPFIFMLAAQGVVLLFSEKYLKVLLGVSLFNLLGNVVGNLIFIPIYGVYAAAWMTVVSQILAFVIYFFIIYYAINEKSR
jgi:O-antigen/teichoic acid export membrane protein